MTETRTAQDPAAQTPAEKNLRLREHMLSLDGPAGWEENDQIVARSLADLVGAEWLTAVRNVFVVGHGTSYATSQLIESWLSRIAGVRATALPAFRLAHYTEEHLLDPASTLVIGVSCSGNTATVVDALTRADERGAATMIISGQGGIDAARVAGARIETHAHVERAVVSAYSISHLFIALAGYRFAELLGLANGNLDEQEAAVWHRRLDGAIESLAVLPDLFDRMGEIAAVLDPTALCVLGTGPNTGTMTEGALKISEFCWKFGAGEELEDFAHGRFREVGSDEALLIVAPDGPAIPKTRDLLVGSGVSQTPTVVFTDSRDAAVHKLATHVVEMPALDDEYLTPFLYVFPLWFYGWHLMHNAGGVVGDKRHGLFAVDIDFDRHFDAHGNRKEA